jgi:hypothetical protein
MILLASFLVGWAAPLLATEPTDDAVRHRNTSIFMADYPADRYLLDPYGVLRSPLGLMLLTHLSQSLKKASPATCKLPDPPAPTDGSPPLTTQDVTDDLMVEALIKVLEGIETKRWAEVDEGLRDKVMREAITDAEFEELRALVQQSTVQDTMALRSHRLAADAVVELGIAFDRFLKRTRTPVIGPINVLELRQGLEAYDRVLEAIEDGMQSVLARPADKATFDRWLAIETKRALAVIDAGPDQAGPGGLPPLRPKLKHVKSIAPIDTEDVWEPMAPIFKRLCIERRQPRG